MVALSFDIKLQTCKMNISGNHKKFTKCNGSLRGGKEGDTERVTGDNIAFIYSDMRTAFVGRFEGKVMVDAREMKKMKEHVP